MFKGWRTLILNGAASVLPVMELVGTVANIPEMRQIVPAEYWPVYMVGLTIANGVLRKYTNTAIGKRN